jgi:hypothetical protein
MSRKPFWCSMLRVPKKDGGFEGLLFGQIWAVEKWQNCRKMSLVGYAD